MVLVRGSRPGKQVQLAEYEIRFLCTKAREIFINQPILLELEAPLKICGIVPIPLYTHPQHNHYPFFPPRLLLVCFCYKADIVRRHTRPILRLATSIRVRWFPTRSKLSLPRRLRRPGKTILGNNMSPPRLQNQVSRKLFHTPRKPRMCFHQPDLWIL